jgi:xylose isomerase
MVGMLGRMADRFHEYHPARDLQERLQMASQVSEIDGIEIVYPSEFADTRETIRLVKDSGLAVSAVNLNVKQAKQWEQGSFTNPNPRIRASAVNELKTAMDLAAEFGTDMVSCCPLIDGHNYSFEVDYLKQWGWLEEGISEGARHRQDIRLSLEYKLNESRNYNLLSDAGRALYLCERVNQPNIGVTVDIGHALIAKETPAEALSLAALSQRLFYVHFNDNGREWDWDMLPGAVNFWDLIEVMFYLKRIDWDGWLSYDIVSRSSSTVNHMSASISIVNLASELVEKIGRAKLESYIECAAPDQTFESLIRALL